MGIWHDKLSCWPGPASRRTRLWMNLVKEKQSTFRPQPAGLGPKLHTLPLCLGLLRVFGSFLPSSALGNLCWAPSPCNSSWSQHRVWENTLRQALSCSSGKAASIVRKRRCGSWTQGTTLSDQRGARETCSAYHARMAQEVCQPAWASGAGDQCVHTAPCTQKSPHLV